MSQIKSQRRRRFDRKRIATRFAVAGKRFADRITFALLAVLATALTSSASELTVSVIDRDGRGVSGVVVTVASVSTRASAPAAAKATAVMDQQHLTFDPSVLVVAVGTSVEFPNNDSVSHQVYSFSHAKNFQLPLYKGQRHPPVIFEQTGLVVLGCNIHDEMVGYIYVTDAPFFGKTDSSGSLRLVNLPAGDYQATVWSPFIADPPEGLIGVVQVATQEAATSRVLLKHDLRARPEPRPRRGDWEY